MPYFNPAKIIFNRIMAGLKKYYKRNLENEIEKYLAVKEIIAIVGVRQCGKTTLMKKIADDLNSEYKVNFVSFDDVSILRLFEEDIDSFVVLLKKLDTVDVRYISLYPVSISRNG